MYIRSSYVDVAISDASYAQTQFNDPNSQSLRWIGSVGPDPTIGPTGVYKKELLFLC